MCSPHTLYFVGTSGGPPGGADNSTVIDSVSLNTASEPAALGFLPAVVVHSVLRSQSEARYRRTARSGASCS